MSSSTLARTVLLISATTALAFSTLPKAAATTFNPDPLFKDAAIYTTVVAANGDPVDIYYPKTRRSQFSFPVALLLQGALIDKSLYSEYASLVAKYGFVVVVPNHTRSVAGLSGSSVKPLKLML